MGAYDFSTNSNLRSGILAISEAAIVSFVCSFGLLTHSLRQGWVKYQHYRYSTYSYEDESPLQPISILFLFAVFFDMLAAFSNILSARWGLRGKVIEDSYCTAQAVLKQMGGTGVAWFTIAIAVLTFLQVMFPGPLGLNGARYFTIGAIAFIFTFLVLIIAIPSSTIHPLYGNAGLWCWIVDTTASSRALWLGGEYVYLWLGVLVSFVLYGTIAVKWFFGSEGQLDPKLRRDAISMGWYPIAYITVVAPQSTIRFLQWPTNPHRPSHGWMILTQILFTSGGTFNTILWIWTGRRFGFSRTRGDEVRPTA